MTHSPPRLGCARFDRTRARAVIGAVALAGLALATAVIIWMGGSHIIAAIFRIGWLGLVYVLSWQLAVFVLMGIAWWALSPQIHAGVFIWARLVRSGGQTCLPLSEIGGLVFGARALMLSGVDAALAAASSIVDVIAEAAGLLPLLVFGLIVLLTHHAGASVTLLMGLALGTLLFGGAIAFAFRGALARLLHRGTTKLLKPWLKDAPHRATELEQSVAELFRHKRRVAIGSLLHVLCWCGGGGNVWIAYHLLGAKPTVVEALAIESMLSGALSVALLVPAGLGVQELTYVGIGGLFGIPAYLSLALSLIRRTRDILIGAPALWLWQGLEARHLRQE